MSHLSYLGAKCVIEYLNFYKRYSVVKRCPAYYSLPLPKRHDTTDNVIQIQRTTFKLGIIRIYTEGEAPQCVKRQNARGGISEDVDDFGFPIKEDQGNLTELLNSKNESNIEWICQRRALRANGADETDLEVQRCTIRIDEYHISTQALQHKIDGTPPPYKLYLQLTIHSPGIVRIERVEYNKTIPEAIAYLKGKLFN